MVNFPLNPDSDQIIVSGDSSFVWRNSKWIPLPKGTETPHPGDILFSTDSDKNDPSWLKADGRIIDPAGVYPALAEISSFLKIETLSLLSEPSQKPANTVWTASLSKTDNSPYFAFGSRDAFDQQAAFLYKKEQSGFIQLSNPANFPPSSVSHYAFSPNSDYLALGMFTSPILAIYKRTNDTFTKLADPSFIPSNYIAGLVFSHDGNYLAIAAASSGVFIYKRNGDIFTKLTDPPAIPNDARSVSFSYDDQYLLCSGSSIVCYKRTGDTFNNITDNTGISYWINFSRFFKTSYDFFVSGTTLQKGKVENDTLIVEETISNINTRSLSMTEDEKYAFIGSNLGSFDSLQPFYILRKDESTGSYVGVLDGIIPSSLCNSNILYTDDSDREYLIVHYETAPTSPSPSSSLNIYELGRGAPVLSIPDLRQETDSAQINPYIYTGLES